MSDKVLRRRRKAPRMLREERSCAPVARFPVKDERTAVRRKLRGGW